MTYNILKGVSDCCTIFRDADLEKCQSLAQTPDPLFMCNKISRTIHWTKQHIIDVSELLDESLGGKLEHQLHLGLEIPILLLEQLGSLTMLVGIIIRCCLEGSSHIGKFFQHVVDFLDVLTSLLCGCL